MKTHLSSLAMLAALAGITLVNPALAEVSIDYVTVGNPGNAADPQTGGLYGAVSYTYRIGTYEVTNDQYTEFLNAVAKTDTYGLYIIDMGSASARGGITRSGSPGGYVYTVKTNMGDKPVNFVSWYDAARFTNWLGNGQGNGSTETGAYTLSGDTGIITKNAGATFWIPSEDEWYKAAYYDPSKGGTGGFWQYPTKSDSAPEIAAADATGSVSNPGANVANYTLGADWNAQNGNVTTTPISPPSGPSQWLFQGPPAESKFLAVRGDVNGGEVF
jgi:sulfatase modifying factor 1